MKNWTELAFGIKEVIEGIRKIKCIWQRKKALYFIKIFTYIKNNKRVVSVKAIAPMVEKMHFLKKTNQ